MEDRHGAVRLEPFAHQVGGHACMLRYDDTSVCKPLINREKHFYQIMPQELRAFTPQFRGVVEVLIEKDNEGYTCMTAFPQAAPSSSSLSNRRCSASKSRSVPNLMPGSSSPSSGGDTAQSDSDSDSEESCFKPSASSSIRRRRVPSSPETGGSSNGRSPWCVRLHRELLAKMQNQAHTFIVLENLAARFQLPCILDLKMGTRQHGDDASDEKRRSQIRKCESTTSSQLGTRLCGMKVYKADTGRYVCLDKYYGRGLDKEGVVECLRAFLHNGRRLCKELIRPILRSLQQLRQVIQQQNTFRFYSSSLLIMYEGVDDLQPQECAHHDNEQTSSEGCATCARVDVRMIDFAHVTHQGFRGDHTVHAGPDAGYLLGLSNLVLLFEQLLQQCSD
ncbi:hypothetical protein CAPTEDRAFT_164378 [Capitella teleta]|uniref:Kinase n=1 Tax=Capitella teleta TaxID=283909 RepID=R7UK36_CAPTE|nr:hypothetical protein CAPTEDRAFT_164378 [Capitella teleta]|eukprot:ELU06458.1 hypothetical protein CAPTEDRAFT_164378 [Capitella teleta]